MLGEMVKSLVGRKEEDDDQQQEQEQKKMMIKGRVVLMKKNVVDFNDLAASVLDRFHELVGHKVSLQLISSRNTDSENRLKGKVGKAAYLEKWITTFTSLTPGDSAFDVSLIGEEADKYKTARIFFTNKSYLPGETPAPLLPYREEELVKLRGDGSGPLEEWDRVYDYAYYNDLGDPTRDKILLVPFLGDLLNPNSESRIPLLMSLNIYVPRDERFGHLKMSDFLGYGLKSIFQFLLPEFKDLCESISNEFESFEDARGIYEGGFKLPDGPLLKSIYDNIPLELLKQLLPIDGEGLFKFPMPKVIQEDKSAWRTDEEFAREMVAGLNPVIISRIQEFPPASNLDPKLYGNQTSTIAPHHIQNQLDGLTIDEAIKTNRLYILNHHDSLMPYLRRINTTTTKTYASRTLLFLQHDGRLRPLAIELSLPHPDGDQFGAVSKVYTPSEDGVEGSIWQLAKAYAAVNDSGVHQLISHWLHTHAVIEPFVIATNRQLSVLHPIYKLLHPHFRDTMNINAVARQVLINGGGILEATVFPAKYSMEMSAVIYKDWAFPDQALPVDLVKRGIAVEDSKSPHGLRLLIEDYPYAVDGLEIWSAIESWVEDYCTFYYASDDMVQNDRELQSWWKELREKGHADKKNEPWWPKMQTRKELIDSCTIIIWVASALHAALNFGQYHYAGYMPNRPTISRQFMPEPGTKEYEELRTNPDKVFLRTITARLQTLVGIALIELLSRHSSDEIYLGQRDTPEWTADAQVVEAFDKFGKKLGEIEKGIIKMNNDEKWKNRVGAVEVPYTLLYPTSEDGLTGKGIPNSVSI
ncbi:putative linoleate 9S-lipoxygenase 5 [Sesamum angolense]|uniref:Lipoxygenase n=1 Tax=Sesamum angolense TaxID=2727404 RepID=A0AAE2BYJ3_9LAMI|nr:putative linoleate 9S-lipoxygenase 5 [Sesamum angolense]